VNQRIEISKLSEELGEIDIFICSSSFEERSTVVSKAICTHSIDSVLVCHNIDLKDHLESNTRVLLSIFENASRIYSVNFHNDQPILALTSLLERLNQLEFEKEQLDIVVDITTFTHEGLLLLLRVIRSLYKKPANIRYVYTEAADYSIHEANKEDKWLSKGVKEIRSVLGYAGTLMPSKKLHLVIMLGFGIERASYLIDMYEPHIISVGIGNEMQSINKQFHEINEMGYKQLSLIYSQVSRFEFSCIDPESTRLTLFEQINKYSDHNIVIAPMNTKISTVGAALVAFDNKDVQLIYAGANHYNYFGFSLPGKHCYLFDLPRLAKS
jgi:hypothetical protein